MQNFLNYINRFVELSQEEFHLFQQGLKIRTFRKKEMILNEGELANKFWFNSEGFVRLFYLVEGQERTAFFYPKNTFVSDYESYVKGVPSKMNFQAIEDTVLIEISREMADIGLLASPKLANLAIKFMEDEFVVVQNLIRSLLTESPEKRYWDLIKDSPEIIEKVPQNQISSYLGIQPESLSRIKKRAFQIS